MERVEAQIFTEGGEVALVHWGNNICLHKIEKNPFAGEVLSNEGLCDAESTNYNKTVNITCMRLV